MQAALDIDARGFTRALEEISRTTGIALQKVIRAETGSILKACAGDTKVATKAAADVRARLRHLRDIGLTQPGNTLEGVTVNAGVRGPAGRIWLRGPSSGRFRLAGTVSDRGRFRPERYHWSNAQWEAIQDAIYDFTTGLQLAIKNARDSIGLARQSWVQIADDLGIRLESVPGGRLSAAGIAKARAAIASSGSRYVNGLAAERATNTEFFITLRNRLPYGAAIGLDRILARNINARVRFFNENMRRGVFDHLSAVAKKYPGLEIRNN